MLNRHATEEERKIVGERLSDDWENSLNIIQEYFPDMLTQEALEFLSDIDAADRKARQNLSAERDKENKMGHWAPVITIEIEVGKLNEIGTATDRQKTIPAQSWCQKSGGVTR